MGTSTYAKHWLGHSLTIAIATHATLAALMGNDLPIGTLTLVYGVVQAEFAHLPDRYL